jgi:hypothetical protein
MVRDAPETMKVFVFRKNQKNNHEDHEDQEDHEEKLSFYFSTLKISRSSCLRGD